MYEKISERSEGVFVSGRPTKSWGRVADAVFNAVLDQVIDDFADLIKDQFDIEELADPSAGTDVRKSKHPRPTILH